MKACKHAKAQTTSNVRSFLLGFTSPRPPRTAASSPALPALGNADGMAQRCTRAFALCWRPAASAFGKLAPPCPTGPPLLLTTLPPAPAPLQVDFGQQVLLVGDAPQLGSWELGNAPHMSWSEGDTWTATVDLPEGASVEYKFVLQNPGQ